MKRDPEDKKNLSRRDFVKTTAAGVGAAALTGLGAKEADAQARPPHWDKEADVVVVGAGASGLPAAIEAAEHGASVILIDANFDVGGHAILSGGNVALGGGTSRQKKYGVEDSPDIVFRDLTDWSVVEPNGFPDYRYNDKEIIRAFADNSAPTYEWLVAHGVIFVEKAPDSAGGDGDGNSAPRENHAAPMAWPQMQTGKPVDPAVAATTSSGVGLIRPARSRGPEGWRADPFEAPDVEPDSTGAFSREEFWESRPRNEGKTLHIRARKGVILATGGSSSNVNFRRIFDTRLTEEYDGVAGEPYSFQDASGELAAIAIGASLWGAYNDVGEFGQRLTKAGRIGCQYGYRNLEWQPGSPIFHLARARGLRSARLSERDPREPGGLALL